MIHAVQKRSLELFDIINDLRLHVLLNYFLTVSWFLYAIRVSAQGAVEYALVVTCLAGFAYLLNRFTDYDYDLIVDKNLKKVNKNVYPVLSITFLVLSFFFLYGSILPIISLPVITVTMVLGLLFGYVYSMKTILPLPFKNYFIVKNVTAATSKMLSLFLGGLILSPLGTSSLLVLMISVFSIHFIYELLWDIRDTESDRVGHVSTFPVRYGKNRTLLLCVAVWVLSATTALVLRDASPRFFMKYALILIFIGSTSFISHPRFFHAMIYAHIALNLVFVNTEVLTYISGLIS